eukprot:scaffold34274_cov157-Skeletonema_marinoi.AAC.1
MSDLARSNCCNPSALRTLENNFALPLHIACEYHESADVIQYLVGLDAPTLDAVEGTETQPSILLAAVNANKKLPIHLLWKSSDSAVLDRGSIEYTESVFRLLRAYPESSALGAPERCSKAESGEPE